MSESTASELVKIYDGDVLIRSAGDEYQDSEANYALDAGAPFPVLPEGDIGRTYILGERHKTTTGGKATQHPMPWVEGDAILASLPALVTAQATRTAPPPPLPPRPPIPDSAATSVVDLKNDFNALVAELRALGIIS